MEVLNSFKSSTMYNLQFKNLDLKLHWLYCCWVCNGPNELHQCILLGASYVQRVVHALNDHFPDLPIFNATKLLSPCHHPSDDSDQTIITKL